MQRLCFSVTAISTVSFGRIEYLKSGSQVLVNAVTGEVKSGQNHMYGYPTNQALTQATFDSSLHRIIKYLLTARIHLAGWTKAGGH